MHTERRGHKRYVIDGLMIELGDVVHETVDVSVRTVAALRKAGVDYGNLSGQARFMSEKSAALDRPIAGIRPLYERRTMIVIDYFVDQADWEAVLAAHDVRADTPKLENVFG